MKQKLLHKLLGPHLHKLISALFGTRAHLDGKGWHVPLDKDAGVGLSIEGTDPQRLGHWYNTSPGAPVQKGDILDLIRFARETDDAGAAAFARAFLAHVQEDTDRSTFVHTDLQRQAGTPLKLANPRSLKQATKALRRHRAAMARLKRSGFKASVIRQFDLGLYSYARGVQDALAFPARDVRGRPLSRIIKTFLEGVTKHPPDESFWATGKPGTYWVTPADDRRELFICQDAREGWWLWQNLAKDPLLARLCLVCPTHGKAIPEAWREPAFWQSWKRVYVACRRDETGTALAQEIGNAAGRDVYRIDIPFEYGKTWGDFFKSGQTAHDLALLLADPPILGLALTNTGTHQLADVRDLSRTFNGFLYRPFRVLENSVHEKTLQKRYATLVLRSDGTVCSLKRMPAPRGTPEHARVLALSDGTPISRPPGAEELLWAPSLQAIRRFQDRPQGESAVRLSPAQLIHTLETAIEATCAFMRHEECVLVVLTVLASYLRPVFDGFPILNVTGPGRMQLGRILAHLGYGGTVLQKNLPIYEAALRLDRAPGLAVIDARNRSWLKGDAVLYDQFIQQLGASVWRSGAKGTWTDPRTLEDHVLDFSGVRVILDAGPRALQGTPLTGFMVQITRAERNDSVFPAPWADVRDNLSLWALEHAGDVHESYRSHLATADTDLDRLTAPFYALADGLDDLSLTAALPRALAFQGAFLPIPATFPERVTGAVHSLIQQGATQRVTLIQLTLELKLMAAQHPKPPDGHNPENETELDLRHLGRVLRSEGLVVESEPTSRARLFGMQTRVYTLNPSVVRHIRGKRERSSTSVPGDPLDFCTARPCRTCRYQDICPLKALKNDPA